MGWCGEIKKTEKSCEQGQVTLQRGRRVEQKGRRKGGRESGIHSHRQDFNLRRHQGDGLFLQAAHRQTVAIVNPQHGRGMTHNRKRGRDTTQRQHTPTPQEYTIGRRQKAQRDLVCFLIHSIWQECSSRNQTQCLTNFRTVETPFILQAIHHKVILIHQVPPHWEVRSGVIPGGLARAMVHKVGASQGVLHCRPKNAQFLPRGEKKQPGKTTDRPPRAHTQLMVNPGGIQTASESKAKGAPPKFTFSWMLRPSRVMLGTKHSSGTPMYAVPDATWCGDTHNHGHTEHSTHQKPSEWPTTSRKEHSHPKSSRFECKTAPKCHACTLDQRHLQVQIGSQSCVSSPPSRCIHPTHCTQRTFCQSHSHSNRSSAPRQGHTKDKHTHTHVYIYSYTHMYTYMHTCIHTHTHSHIYSHKSIYVPTERGREHIHEGTRA